MQCLDGRSDEAAQTGEAVKVNSSAISDLDYDAENQVLTVTWNSGSRSRHEGVSAELHQQLLDAPSLGRAFQKLVRNQFPSTTLP